MRSSIALAVPRDADATPTASGRASICVVRAMLDGEEMRRTYSICSDPDDNELWITIKRVDGGLFSTCSARSA